MKKLVLVGLIVGLSVFAQAEIRGAIGVAGENIDSAYAGVDNHTKFIPMVFVEHEDFYAKGTRFGAYIYNDNTYFVGTGVSIDFSSVDRNDNSTFKEMDELRGRGNLNLILERRSEIVNLFTSIDRDISGASDGFRVTAQLSKPFEFGDLTIEPKIGVVWSDEDTNNYLYGIDSNQATADYTTYTSTDSIEPYAEVMVRYRFTKFLGLIGGVKYKKLDDTIMDSPMVDGKSELSVKLGLLFFFKID